ncbi:Junction plakoglobin [Fasciola gigantica]|uniref:Junction plakoglobin n=1 Tax=Fasciola gigantica TaxID=46835 RepID=A0A504YAP5_FASGI|nr:Junction plakoglobin [Fasciola gigantica]
MSTYSLTSNRHLFTQAIHCLLMPDEDCVVNASEFLFYLCKSGFTTLLMQTCPEVISTIFPIVCVSCKNLQAMHFLSGVMHYLSHTPDGVDFILNSGGVNILAHFLASPIESVLYYTVTTIHNLLLVRRSGREIIQQSLVVSHLVRLLNFSVNFNTSCDTKCKAKNRLQSDEINPKFMTVLCDCLQILAYGHEATKKTFLDESGMPSLLNLIMSSDYEKVLWTSTRLLRVLSAWMPAKLEILSQDPECTFFTHCVAKGSLRLTANALWTLRNLSDIAVDKLDFIVVSSIIEQVHSQLQNVLLAIQSSSFNGEMKDQYSVARCILGILGNLTCGNNAIKSQLIQLNGIDVITRVMVSVLGNAVKRPTPSMKITASPNRFATIPGTINSRKSSASTLSDSLSNLSIHPHDPFTENPTCTRPNQSLCWPEDNSPEPEFTSVPRDHWTDRPTTRSPLKSAVQTCLQTRSDLSPPNANPTNRLSWDLHDITQISSTSTSFHNPHSNSGPTLDLLEAGFRCLSHLTAGHPEAARAVNYFYQQRLCSRLVGTVLTHILLPLLSYSANCPSSDISLQTNCENAGDRLHRIQTLQLIRAWATLVNNLCAHIPLGSPVISTITRGRSRLSQHEGKCVYMRLPKYLASQLRRSIRPLDQALTGLFASMPDRPRELVSAQDLVRHLLEKLPRSGPTTAAPVKACVLND